MTNNKNHRIKIIAEVGVNHNGNINIAKKFIRLSKEAGADIVKYQVFTAKNFVSAKALKADYQKKNSKKTKNQLEMLKGLELSRKTFSQIYYHCKKQKIEFLASIFDFENFDLIKKFNFKRIKISSGEINNFIYLDKVSKYKLPLIISTGGSTLSEIDKCINFLIKKGTALKEITLLQCNSEYPSPFVDINLKVMETLKKNFDTDIGISDHSLGIEVPIAAAALGAKIIEKHVTLNNRMKGPDHAASLGIKDFKIMISKIRNIEEAMGNGVKLVSNSEKKNVLLMRKSIFAKTEIKNGEIFTDNNISLKRPPIGVQPIMWDKLKKKKAHKTFKKDQLITLPKN